MKAEELWRKSFDAVERPVASVSESWIQTDVFMDALAVAYRAQRRVTRPLQRGMTAWWRLWGLPAHADVLQVVNQVASLERKVRELERDLERGA